MNRIEVLGELCQISLDQGAQNYLLSPEFISPEELAESIEGKGCKAILIAGSGRHFSAGADRESLSESIREHALEEEISRGHQLFKLIRSFQIPVIACIEGACFGGGLEIALLADVKIASSNAMFAFPESNLDLMPGLGGIYQTVGISGKAATLDLVLRGDVIDAETALDLKLIDYLVDPKSSLQHGLELAGRLTRGRDLEVIKAVVEAVRNAGALDYDAAMERESELFCRLAIRAAQQEDLG